MMNALLLSSIVALLVLGPRRTREQRTAGARLGRGALLAWLLCFAWVAYIAAAPVLRTLLSDGP